MGEQPTRNEGARGFGALLRGLRRQQGLTQAELAVRARVAQTYISDLERGTGKQPSAVVLGRLAAALDVPAARLAPEIWAAVQERQQDLRDGHLAELAGIWTALLPSDQEVLLYLARALHQRRAPEPPGAD